MINIGSLRLISNAFSLFLWDFLYKSTYIAVWLWGKEEERKGLLFASICQKGVNKTYHRTGWARLLKPVMKPLSPSSPLPCSESLPVPLPFCLCVAVPSFLSRTLKYLQLVPCSPAPSPGPCLALPLQGRTFDVMKVLCGDEEPMWEASALPAVSWEIDGVFVCALRHVT